MKLDMLKTDDGCYLYRTETSKNNPESGRYKSNRVVLHRPKKKSEWKTLVYIGDKIRTSHAKAHDQGYVYVNVASILSIDDSNKKLAKTARKFRKVLSVIYYGAPSDVAGMGINTCRHASRVCRLFCLNTAGNGSITGVQLSRIARTRLSRWATAAFWAMFEDDLNRFLRKAKREKKRLACRPNGTTDEHSAELIRLIRKYQDVDWYDYTAVPDALDLADELENYSLTFSRKETHGNLLHVKSARKRGFNIAAVCDPDVKDIALRKHPEVFVDFDSHDLRLPSIDGSNRVGLLTPKGIMRRELQPTTKKTMTYKGYAQLIADFLQ